jgi:hypothetical protein
LFFARQIKDKTGSAATRKKALDREKVKTDSNHVPTSVDAYNDGALEEWFDEGPRCQNSGFKARNYVDLYCESDWDYVNDDSRRRDTACVRAV